MSQLGTPDYGKQYWPIFLVGCHRSGTTLLRFLLDSHEDLACPPESKFVAGLETLLDYPQALEGLQSLGFSREGILTELRRVVDAFLGGYAKRHRKKRWIDKTPNYYRLLPFIDELFQGRVLYLFLIRHPLDSVASLESWTMTSSNSDPDLARAVREHGQGRLAWARYWNDVNEHILVFARAHAERCHTVRYEDLVRSPNRILCGICEFLGERFDESLVRKAFVVPHTAGGFEDHKIRSTSGIVSNVGVWRAWPPGEAAALWKTVHSNAEEFGYSLAGDEVAESEDTTDASQAAAFVSTSPADSRGVSPEAGRLQQQFVDLIDEAERRLDQQPAVLDWNTGLDLARAFPGQTIFKPVTGDAALPYLDQSIDVVIVRGGAHLAEARRVAKIALAQVADNSLAVEWKPALVTTAVVTSSLIACLDDGIENAGGFLRALQGSLPGDLAGELVVVDCRSNSNSRGFLEEARQLDPRMKVVRAEIGCSAAQARNHGAREASGEILVFIDQDIVPQPGWLPPLLRTFRQFPRAGAVGGKLVHANGRLREAGGLVFADGGTARYGDGDVDIDAPLHQYVREVDYCSLALLAIRASVFREIGGLDNACPPEEVTLGFQLRERGYGVYYQPESVGIYSPAGVEDTEPVGPARIQREAFFARWGNALQRQPKRPDGFDRLPVVALPAPDRNTGGMKGRVIVASYGPPEFDRRSGQRRLLDLMEFLAEDGWAVTFLSHHTIREPRYARFLQQRGMAVYDNTTSKEELFAAGRFDLALIAEWPVAEALLPVLRAASPATRIIVDSSDVHFLRTARGIYDRARRSKAPLLGGGFGAEMIRELNAYAAADAVLTVSDKEADFINDLIGDPELAQLVADCEHPEHGPLPLNQRRGIVFIGSFQHKPNVGAVEYLCKQVLPKIDPSLLAQHPVRIIGEGLGEDIQAFAKGLSNVHMVGWVPSGWPYLESARISVAPLLFGAGTKRKVLQSLFAGTPMVTTTIGVEGLPLRHEEHLLVADQAEAFAISMERLLRDDWLWQKLARNGVQQVRETHGRDAVRAHFGEVLRTVWLRDPQPAILDVDPIQKYFSLGEYRALVRRVRETVLRNVPDKATVVVVSKGDDALVQLNGLRAWHFPQNSEGVYAGYYLANSKEVIKNLEGLCSKGAQYFVLPETAFWWLDHYDAFRQHLDTRHQRIWDDDGCIIYRLRVAEPKP